MKKQRYEKIAVTLIMLLTSVTVYSQFGYTLGGTLSDVRSNELISNHKPKLGLFTGISLQYYPLPKSDKLSLVNELNFIHKGFVQDFGNEKKGRNFNYLAFTVLLNYDIVPRFSVHAGYEFGGLMKSVGYNEKNNEKYDKYYKSPDIGLNAGIGYFIVPHRLQLFSRYNYGLRPMMDYYKIDEVGNMTPVRDVKHSNILVGLKLFFGNGKLFLFR